MSFKHNNLPISNLLCLAGIAALLFPVSLLFADDHEHGAILSDACTACHSLDGNNISIGPNISSFKAAELEKILKDFRDGNRPSTLISRQAKIYSDEEIKLISSFISSE